VQKNGRNKKRKNNMTPEPKKIIKNKYYYCKTRNFKGIFMCIYNNRANKFIHAENNNKNAYIFHYDEVIRSATKKEIIINNNKLLEDKI